MNQMRDTRLDLSLVLPCYNPKPGWYYEVARQYRQILHCLPSGTKLEIIVVNDGFSGVWDAVAKKYLGRNCPYFQYISYATNRGKGYAVREGVKAARAPYIIYTDIDLPYTVEDICQVYRTLATGAAELVIGTREASYSKKLTPSRKIASSGCNYLNRRLLGLPYNDIQSGLKGMDSIGRELLLKTRINRFLFDTEFIWMANSFNDIRIKALPVKLREGISFTNLRSSVYLNEIGNFCRIYIKHKWPLIRRFDEAYKSTLRTS